ncbi:hypothetical protein K1719_035183 [Acacia pycnantha]|nr:hypothetical protein K1719_035183 [Acacia pycnantha]
MHISLVAANTTTIEAYEKKTTPKWRYDLGRRKNFEQLLESFQRPFPSLSFPPLPERGDFDLRDVLESPYFFNEQFRLGFSNF